MGLCPSKSLSGLLVKSEVAGVKVSAGILNLLGLGLSWGLSGVAGVGT